uniref:Nucleotidyltransferase family protein n=1 Tax=Prevotella sp. GTC17253 TaxID=3236793 RepID=A0AB33IM18_9BACT
MNQAELYLRFLRFALDSKQPLPSLNELDWEGMYEFANRQSILGVVYQGLERLPKDVSYRPERQLIFKWVATVDQIKRANIQVNQDACRLTAVFKQDGIRSCVLKGQANARLYPNPLYRMPGDIDIWTDMKRAKDVVRYVRQKAPTASPEYHHIDWPNFGRTPIEVHFFPSFMGNLYHEILLRRYFEEQKNSQFDNFVALSGVAGQGIYVLNGDMDCVFQLSHIMHHFFFEGIGLRQIIDYYYLLKCGVVPEAQADIARTLEKLHMLTFSKGVMWILSEVLGLDRKYLYTTPDENIGKLLLAEILHAGNFGFFDTRYNFKGLPLYKQYLLEVRRNLRFARYFPSEVLWGRPIARFWHSFYKFYLRKSV